MYVNSTDSSEMLASWYFNIECIGKWRYSPALCYLNAESMTLQRPEFFFPTAGKLWHSEESKFPDLCLLSADGCEALEPAGPAALPQGGWGSVQQ